jgi:hypothetical protein
MSFLHAIQRAYIAYTPSLPNQSAGNSYSQSHPPNRAIGTESATMSFTGEESQVIDRICWGNFQQDTWGITGRVIVNNRNEFVMNEYA